jgi:ABC-type multidrug transport system fused ATPase/permease subunit
LLLWATAAPAAAQVVFRYPTDLRKPVLQGISFTVEPGQKVALVGPTGCACTG